MSTIVTRGSLLVCPLASQARSHLLNVFNRYVKLNLEFIATFTVKINIVRNL